MMNSVKFYKKLREKKYILENNMFIVEGEHLVKEAYNSGNLIEVLSTNKTNYDVKNTILTKENLKSISTLKSTPDIMGVVKLNKNNSIVGKKIVILDNVQDPGNVGTIIRSAVAFNVDTIVLSNDSVSIFNDKLVRSTEGMIFKINIVRMDLKEAFSIIKKMNIKIYYADMYGSIDLDNINIKEYALVLGSEGKGISEYVRKNSDASINIPMNNKCESLNVAVTGGIIMYKFR